MAEGNPEESFTFVDKRKLGQEVGDEPAQAGEAAASDAAPQHAIDEGDLEDVLGAEGDGEEQAWDGREFHG